MNRLVLAVAGGRKTQSLIERCAAASSETRILLVTYTRRNQEEIRRRLGSTSLCCRVDVQGWFSFLLGDWVRPYLLCKFAGERLRGLNFDGEPGRFVTGRHRYLDATGRAYRRHLAELALLTNAASNGAVLNRLSRIYDSIYIDEVQDFNGYDLEVLRVLFDSDVTIHMVGDIRQALLDTNVKELRNKQYKGTSIGNWFAKEKKAGRLIIEHQSTTWRCNQLIAQFADSIFDDSWGFPATTSVNDVTTGHDGVFSLAAEHVKDYVEQYHPTCLRVSAASGRNLDLEFTNIGVSKGMGVPRILVILTDTAEKWLKGKGNLTGGAACSLYVAVTRAENSVALVAKNPRTLGLDVWTPA